MSLIGLPDVVLQQIVARLDLVDALALSCSCKGLHDHITGQFHNPLCTNSSSVAGAAAAAAQRLHMIAAGGWQGQLLLTAWRQQQQQLQTGQQQKQQQQQQLPMDYSTFYIPSQDVYQAASCFVSDGSASAFMAAASVSATPAAAVRTQYNAATTLSPNHSERHEGRQQHAVPTTAQLQQQQQQQQHLQLVQGHMPPPDPTPVRVPGYNMPHVTTQSTSYDITAQTAANPVADVLAACTSMAGRQQLVNFQRYKLVQHQQQHGQQQQERHEVLKIFMLPAVPIPSSIAALNHHWPPTLSPGYTYQQGHGLGYCSAASGLSPLLHLPLVQHEAALLLPGGAGSSVDNNVLLTVFTAKPLLAQLSHLDVSGHSYLTDSQIAELLQTCRKLGSLAVGGTAAAALSFMLLGTKQQERQQQKFSCSPWAYPIAALADRCRVSAPNGSFAGSAAVSGAQPHISCSSTNHLQGRPPTGGYAADQHSSSYSGSNSPCSTMEFVYQAGLRVLDVSGCPSLQQTDSSAMVFRLFQGALGRLRQLEVLIAQQVNVNAALCPASAGYAASRRVLATRRIRGAMPASPPPAAIARTLMQAPAVTTLPTVSKTAANIQTAADTGGSSSSVTSGGSHSAVSATDSHAMALAATLAHLTQLDISNATCLTVDCLVKLLTTCCNLRHLAVIGCKTLAEQGGSANLTQQLMSLFSRQAGTSQRQQQHRQLEQHRQPEQQQQQQPHADIPTQLQQDAEDSSYDMQQQPGNQQQKKQQQGNHRHQQQQHDAFHAPLPSHLHSLVVGWGWEQHSISSLLATAEFLTSFTAGVGACVTDGLLCHLAATCPHLRHLSLTLCPVSSAGVRVALSGCRKLTCLQLQQCVGPFNMADLLALLPLGLPMLAHEQQVGSQQDQQCSQQQKHQHQQQQQQTYSQQGQCHNQLQQLQRQQQQQHRWQLSTLQLEGPASQSTDDQMSQLLALPATCPQQLQQQQHQQFAYRTDQVKPKYRSVQSCHTPDQRGSHLVNLCLVRVRGLTDQLLLQLTAAGCQLQHLKLEDCYSWSAGSTADSSVAPVDTAQPSFSQSALLQLLRVSCSQNLKSLQLRHAVSPLTVDFVDQVVSAVPLLQRLVLDACDLPGQGTFNYEPQPRGALQAIHVVRCEHLQQSVAHTFAPGAAEGTPTSATAVEVASMDDLTTCKKTQRGYQQLIAEPPDQQMRCKQAVLKPCNCQQQEGKQRQHIPHDIEFHYGQRQQQQQRRQQQHCIEAAAAAGGMVPRTCDKELVVHLLQLGRSLRLPAG